MIEHFQTKVKVSLLLQILNSNLLNMYWLLKASVYPCISLYLNSFTRFVLREVAYLILTNMCRCMRFSFMLTLKFIYWL